MRYEYAITVGCFDMLHQGHTDLFSEMSKRAKKLIVLVHDDYSIYKNKGKFPVQSLEQRLRNIKSIKKEFNIESVDIVVLADPTIAIKLSTKEILKESKKICYVRGNDWQEFPGKQILIDNNIPIFFKEYTKGVSSSQLRDKINQK